MQETLFQKIDKAAQGFTGDMGDTQKCCQALQKQVEALEARLAEAVSDIELRLALDTTAVEAGVAAALAQVTLLLAAQTRLIEALSFQMLPPAVRQVITLGTPVKQ